jgi:hypothetical protein
LLPLYRRHVFGQGERAKREEYAKELDQLKAQSATFRDEIQNLRLQLKAAERCSASSTAQEIRLQPTAFRNFVLQQKRNETEAESACCQPLSA